MFTQSKRWSIDLLAQCSKATYSILAKSSSYKATAWEKRLMTTGLSLALMQEAMAQGGTAAALSGVQETIITIVQILFSIILVIGLIRVVMKFVNGNPDALSALGWLVGGVILWFGFQFFKDDLVGTVGGEGGVR